MENKLKIEALEELENFSKIQDYNSVTILSLSNLNLTKFPLFITNLPYLTTLNIAQNNIQELPAEIGRLGNTLKTLNISNNPISSLPREFGDLIKLEEVTINNSKPYADTNEFNIPNEFGKCLHLRRLICRNIKLKSLPDVFNKLTNLKDIYFDKNILESLPVSLKNATKLQRLSISDNNLSEIPECLPFLASLIKLDIRNNKLTAGQKSALMTAMPNISDLLA